MKFSIVTPVYNVGKFLTKCIESLMSQTYDDIEIILVDDGSKDDSPAICDSYAEKDSRIKVIHKENGGVVSARKAGTEVAVGDYICCVDGDDYVSSDYVENFYKILCSRQYDVVCCGHVEFSEDSEKAVNMNCRCGEYSRDQIISEIYPYLVQSETAKYFSATLWAKAMKRELYLPFQLAVDNKIAMGEDRAVILPFMIKVKDMYVMESCSYYYRHNQSSMTKVKKPLSWEQEKALVDHIYGSMIIEDYDFEQQLYRWAAHDIFNVAKSQFNSSEKYKVIKNKIKEYMGDPIYKTAIEKCHFSGSISAKLMELALIHKWIFLMYLYNKVY